jgi:hypothetical protein
MRIRRTTLTKVQPQTWKGWMTLFSLSQATASESMTADLTPSFMQAGNLQTIEDITKRTKNFTFYYSFSLSSAIHKVGFTFRIRIEA